MENKFRPSFYMPKPVLLPEQVPLEDYRRLYDTVFQFFSDHELTVRQAGNILFNLNQAFESRKVEQKFDV